MRLPMVVAVLGVLSWSAQADDLQTNVDEASGNWAAVSIADGSTTKICAVTSVDHKLLFRADDSDLELRSSNDVWSLSADAEGDLQIKIGSVQKTIHMRTFNATTLVAVVDPAVLSDLMNAMDKAATATSTFGTKKTFTMSLSGSTRALNSFRTCSAVHGFAKLGGSTGQADNPF